MEEMSLSANKRQAWIRMQLNLLHFQPKEGSLQLKQETKPKNKTLNPKTFCMRNHAFKFYRRVSI